MRIKREDFDQMLRELFTEEPARHDTLCQIVMQELLPTVRSWCANDNALRGDENEAFIIISITIEKIIKYGMNGFFFRNGREEPNTDMDEFCKWIFTVAKNVKRDLSNDRRAHDFVDYNELEERVGDEIGNNHVKEEVAATFDIAFDLNISVYKLLAWLATSIVILEEVDDQTDAIRIVVDRFAERPLNEMWKYVLSRLNRYPILAPSEYEIGVVRNALDSPSDDGVPYGEHNFGDFFMAKGGKYSLSDWLHKINRIITRRFTW